MLLPVGSVQISGALEVTMKLSFEKPGTVAVCTTITMDAPTLSSECLVRCIKLKRTITTSTKAAGPGDKVVERIHQSQAAASSWSGGPGNEQQSFDQFNEGDPGDT